MNLLNTKVWRGGVSGRRLTLAEFRPWYPGHIPPPLSPIGVSYDDKKHQLVLQFDIDAAGGGGTCIRIDLDTRDLMAMLGFLIANGDAEFNKFISSIATDTASSITDALRKTLDDHLKEELRRVTSR